MNILFLTRSYSPNVGGVEKHIEEITKLLIEKKHKVTIITENSSKSYSKNYHSISTSANNTGIENLTVIRISIGKDNWFKKFRIWIELFKYLNVIRNSEIVHAHDVYFWYFPFRFLFPLKRSFVTFHGYEGNKIPGFKAKFMHKLSEFLSTGNICVGEFLEKWYGTKADYITYGAVGNIAIANKSNIKQNRIKAVFLGRLESEADILEYLKAVAYLRSLKIKILLDVYGEGSLLNQAKTFVKKNKLNVSFKGFIKNADTKLSNYDIAFVSRYLAILEALAAGIKVFSIFNNQIKKDYLEMTPFANFIIIAKNGLDLSIQFKNNNYRLFQKVKDGKKWAEQQTWERLTNTYLSLWQRN